VVGLVCEGYLAPLRSRGVGVVLLGCTHYPLLRDAIAATLGPDVQIVDSGAETSRAVRSVLADAHALRTGDAPGQLRCYVSDHPERFRTVGSRFLKCPIEQVEYVPAERYVASTIQQRAR
jgi:glutamate racemase